MTSLLTIHDQQYAARRCPLFNASSYIFSACSTTYWDMNHYISLFSDGRSYVHAVGTVVPGQSQYLADVKKFCMLAM